MFSINFSGLDDAIDERIDESWDIANNCPDIIDDNFIPKILYKENRKTIPKNWKKYFILFINF